MKSVQILEAHDVLTGDEYVRQIFLSADGINGIH